MKNIKSYVKNNPVWSFSLFTFIFSWSCFLILLSFAGFSPPTKEKYNTIYQFAAIFMLAGPAVSSVSLTWLLNGRAGLIKLFSPLIKYEVNFHWYLLALLLVPLLAAAVLFALSLNSAITIESDKFIVFLSGLCLGLITVLEEIGWTGFAVPRLRQRFSILNTGLIVGGLWAAWQIFQIIWISGLHNGELALAPFTLMYFLATAVQLLAIRIILVWVYERTGSMFVTTLMHASFSASVIIIFQPVEMGARFLSFQWLLAAVFWVVVVVTAEGTRDKLSRVRK